MTMDPCIQCKTLSFGVNSQGLCTVCAYIQKRKQEEPST